MIRFDSILYGRDSIMAVNIWLNIIITPLCKRYFLPTSVVWSFTEVKHLSYHLFNNTVLAFKVEAIFLLSNNFMLLISCFLYFI